MKKHVLYLFCALSLMLVAGLPASAALGATSELSIKRMHISVQPEHDDPRILVTYEGDMADSPAMPQEVKFPAPNGSEIGQVCALKQPGNEHLCQLYQTSSDEGALSINYTLPLPNFYLEYYYDGIKGQPDKTFSYEFKAPYPIANLSLEVQQPLRSSSFNLTPSNASVSSGSQGFKYYVYSFKDVAKGQVISVNGSYTKSDSKPSVAKQSASGASGGANSALPIIFTVIVLMMVGIIAWLVLAQKRRPARAHAAASRSHSRPMPRQKSHPVQPQVLHSKREAIQEVAPQKRKGQQQTAHPGTEIQKAAFCTSCGTKLGEGHKFCPGCGTRIGGGS
ncbi:MAG: zinc ribbon domain-containing protein [Chloroflexi bacterium]|nr:zinc ribbon domain-containing protein [Chloroflexota bacterium]